MFPRSASLALASLLLVACGQATSAPAADDPEPMPSATPSTSPSPTEDAAWLTTIPDDIPLDVELPPHGSEFALREVASEPDSPGIDWCGPIPTLAASRTDIAGWSATGPEYAEWRVLRVYESDEAARTATTLLTEHAAACHGEEQDDSASLLGRRPSALPGDESFTVVQTYQYNGLPTLGATFWEVVQVGKALLLTGTYGEYDPTTSLDSGIRHHAKEVAPIVDALCVFDADPC